MIINLALKRNGDCQTYSLYLSISECRLQMTAVITVIVISALKRMGDCLSDIVLCLCVPQIVLQVIAVIAVIINSALKRNGDCPSDISTVLV